MKINSIKVNREMSGHVYSLSIIPVREMRDKELRRAADKVEDLYPWGRNLGRGMVGVGSSYRLPPESVPLRREGVRMSSSFSRESAVAAVHVVQETLGVNCWWYASVFSPEGPGADVWNYASEGMAELAESDVVLRRALERAEVVLNA